MLALVFFVVPTRVHERYLFPFYALAAILAAVSNIPRSEPILDDLLDMDAHNARVQRIRDVIETSFPGVTEFVTDVVGPASTLYAAAFAGFRIAEPRWPDAWQIAEHAWMLRQMDRPTEALTPPMNARFAGLKKTAAGSSTSALTAEARASASPEMS